MSKKQSDEGNPSIKMSSFLETSLCKADKKLNQPNPQACKNHRPTKPHLGKIIN